MGNSTTSLPAVASSTRIVKSTEVTQSLTVSSSRIQKSVSSIAVTTVPSVIETTHLASTQVPTSQVISPTPTVSKEVSSSVTVTPTQPPDPSLLIEAIFKVPTDTDIESEEFKTGLEGKLKDAYLFAEVSRRRKKRATPEVNATVSNRVFIMNWGSPLGRLQIINSSNILFLNTIGVYRILSLSKLLENLFSIPVESRLNLLLLHTAAFPHGRM